MVEIAVALITLAGVIITVAAGNKKTQKSIKEHASVDSIKKDIEELKRHSRENYLGIKRLTVMSHDMPLGERIIAGHDYIKAGGNGDVKNYCKEELHINDIQQD
ncbi:MAG: hypothetical protein U0M06_02590 [Clostridia bacterium]|nr:hypothetical protein [Clostridia bacterium]